MATVTSMITGTGMGTGMIMPDGGPLSDGRDPSTASAAYQLFHLLSPAFPIGSFSYSHGLEAAVEIGAITGEDSAALWLADLLDFGSLGNDGIMLARVHDAVRQGDAAEIGRLAELAVALPVSEELALETTAQGRAFLKTWLDTWGLEPVGQDHRETVQGWLAGQTPALPVAVGLATAVSALPRGLTVVSYLSAAVAALVSALIRLGVLGQTGGQAVLVALHGPVLAAAERVAEAPATEIGNATPAHDILSMCHETQYTRLFRS